MLLRLFTLLLLLLPQVAQAANLFEPVDQDKSIQILAALFGGLGIFGDSSSDAFSEVIKVFNGGVLIIGGLLVAYTIVIGTVGTAHDGEMLGKKFSSVWVPIRTAAGTALVLPVIGGSYCIMQLIVGWLIVQGVGLADNVWSIYMSSDNLARQVQISVEKPETKNLAWNIASSLVCMRGYEQLVNEYNKTYSGVGANATFAMTNRTVGDDTIYSFGGTGGLGFKYNDCGSFTIEKSAGIGAGARLSNFNLFGDASEINTNIAMGDVKHTAAVLAMVSSLDEAAKSFATTADIKALQTAISAAASDYSSATKDIAAPVIAKIANFEELEKSATKDGWMLAGAWYMRMSYLMDVANKTLSKIPESTGSKNVKSQFKEEFVNKYGLSLKTLEDEQKNSMSFGVVESSINQSDTADPGWTDFFTSGYNIDTIMKKMISGLGNLSAPVSDHSHPVMEMKRIGTFCLMAGGILMGAYVMFSVPAPGSIVTALLPIVMILFPLFIATGFTLSYVLPMMPFMIWIGMFLGWIILCTEALIAAPMWAVMHLSPHGDDMVGTGAQGYRLVLSLMLRPVLMIFGLIAALTIIQVLGQMVNAVFFDVFVLAQQDTNWILMLIGFIAAPLLYCGLMWILVTKTLSIMHVIPDQLLQWFGGGGSQLGEYGQTVGGGGSAAFAATAALGNVASKGIDMAKHGADQKQQRIQSEMATISANNDRKSRIDGKLGNGGTDLVSQALQSTRQSEGKAFDASNGKELDSHDAIAIADKLEGAVDSLGGPESASAMEFKDNMSRDLASGKGFTESLQSNLKESLGNKYGSAAAEYLDTTSKGSFAGTGFAKGMEQIETIKGLYSDQTPETIKKKIDNALNHGMSKYDKESGNVNDLIGRVDKSIDHIYNNSSTINQEQKPGLGEQGHQPDLFNNQSSSNDKDLGNGKSGV